LTGAGGVGLSTVSHKSSNPYDVPVFDLMHRPGEMRERAEDIVVDDELATAVIGVRKGSILQLDARLESLHDGILVSGRVDAIASGECVRCLIDVEIPVRVEFQELFAYSFDEAFDYTVHDDHVNLEPVVRDAVVLALPFQPVCRPDCPGLDPETGERLADFPDREPREVLDPRWAALQGYEAAESQTQDAASGSEREES
jgi:uncharacterized protein